MPCRIRKCQNLLVENNVYLNAYSGNNNDIATIIILLPKYMLLRNKHVAMVIAKKTDWPDSPIKQMISSNLLQRMHMMVTQRILFSQSTAYKPTPAQNEWPVDSRPLTAWLIVETMENLIMLTHLTISASTKPTEDVPSAYTELWAVIYTLVNGWW